MIQQPAENPYTSAPASLTLEGVCVSGHVVVLEGAEQQTSVCADGAFSFTLSASDEGTSDYEISQIDGYQQNSPKTSFRWIRQLPVPPTPTLTVPETASTTTSGSTFIISGLCEEGAVVNLNSEASVSTICTQGQFSVTASRSVDGTYTFAVSQTNSFQVTSATVTVQWIRDTSLVPAPNLTAPASNPYYSNVPSVTVSGNCDEGNRVVIWGAESQTLSCDLSGTFSTLLSQTIDGNYRYSFKQVNPNGIESVGQTLFNWVLDTSAPVRPTISSPATMPFVSGDNAVVLVGACETGTTVQLSGADTQSLTCSDGAYSFTVPQGSDGTYDFTITQVDRAGNASEGLPFQWVRDTSIPATPTITSPSRTGSYASNGSLISIIAECITGNTVTLQGDVVAAEVSGGVLTATCPDSSVRFDISKSSDGSYQFALSQQNASGTDSAQSTLRWTRDTVAPAAPMVISPATTQVTSSDNQLLISGTCEADAQVSLLGDDSQAQTCGSGTFLFVVSKSVDGDFSFHLQQTDKAGNVSPATAAIRWTRDSSIPPAPSLLTPSTDPFFSNSQTLLLSGGCSTGMIVKLDGDVQAGEVIQPSGQLALICSNSQFQFVVSKPQDGTFAFELWQASAAGTPSAVTDLTWVRDTAAPTVSITSAPPSPNLATSASIAFAANEGGVIFRCSVDQAAYATCASPLTLSNLSSGNHRFDVVANDTAGNSSAVASTTWSQVNANAILLYHMDADSPYADGGLLASSFNNGLSYSGKGAGATAMFGQSLDFTPATATTTHNALHSLLRDAMTVETWVKFKTLPSNGNYMAIASKHGASGSKAWEYGIKRVGSKYYLYFSGSLNGTNVSEVRSNSITLDTTRSYHLAVTWNLGSVKFFVNGVQKGAGTIGTSGASVLFDSSANLRLGSSASGNALDGWLDELRVSQTVRWQSSFTAPGSAYSAD